MSSDLIDLSSKMGNSKSKSLKCALKHFRDYLAHIKHSKQSLEALEESDINRELLGLFSGYLMQRVSTINKFSTHENYLSAMKVALDIKFPVKMLSLSKAYKNLRDSVLSEYRKASVESGTKFVDGAPEMKNRDLSYICRRCIREGKFELRCFFLMDKFGVGRCTEVIVNQ